MIGAGKRILIIVADTPPHNGKWRHIFGHDRACADNGPVMDLHAAFYGYIAANPDIRADFGIWITVKFLLDAEIVENIIYCGVKICQGEVVNLSTG